MQDGAIYAQPFSEGSAAAAGRAPFGTTARKVEGGWLVNGRKIFASLSGAADYYGVLCTEDKGDQHPDARDTLYLAVPGDSQGFSISGDWDPLGMRGTVSRNLTFKDVFVPDDEQLMPRGIYFKGAQTWPAMFFTLAPTYLGLANAAYDFTVAYLRGEINEATGEPSRAGERKTVRRMYPTKQIAVAQMRIQLESMKSLFMRAIQEAGPNPAKDARMRLYAAHYTRDGRRQRHRAPRDPHLRRPEHDEALAAGTHLPRQPLRLADAALDRRARARPHGPRNAVRERREGRVAPQADRRRIGETVRPKGISFMSSDTSGIAQRFGSGRDVRRLGDESLLKGLGRFTDDIRHDGRAAAGVRSISLSPCAHRGYRHSGGQDRCPAWLR